MYNKYDNARHCQANIEEIKIYTEYLIIHQIVLQTCSVLQCILHNLFRYSNSRTKHWHVSQSKFYPLKIV